MITMSKSLVAILAALFCLLTISCQRQSETTSSQPTIALVLKTLNNPFFIDMQKGAAAGRQPGGCAADCSGCRARGGC